MKGTHNTPRKLVLTLTCGLLIASSGCVAQHLAAFSATFSLGWIVGILSAPTTTTTQCFRNGVEVDCSELLSQTD